METLSAAVILARDEKLIQNWEAAASGLDLTEEEIQNIKLKFGNGVKRYPMLIAHYLLQSWVHKQGCEASIDKLAKVLRKHEFDTSAGALETIWSKLESVWRDLQLLSDLHVLVSTTYNTEDVVGVCFKVPELTKDIALEVNRRALKILSNSLESLEYILLKVSTTTTDGYSTCSEVLGKLEISFGYEEVLGITEKGIEIRTESGENYDVRFQPSQMEEFGAFCDNKMSIDTNYEITC